jgi:hypothetical protein
MKRTHAVLCWTSLLIVMGFVAWPVSFAQDPKPQVLRQLHPDPKESGPPKGIGLLAGYKHKSTKDFEGNQVGEISSPDGVTIKYEMGLSQGMAVDADQQATYTWYREQKANGRITRYALNKSNVLMISIPLDDTPGTLHVANFYGTIKKRDDIADMLLMVLPFAYN